MTTLRDVAELANVSTATVSHVINRTREVTPETRERVERAVERLGYAPDATARTLARRKKSSDADGDAKSGGTNDETDDDASRAPTVTRQSVRSLLRLVRAAQPISRIEIARRLNLNRSTVTEAVKPLLAADVLREAATPTDNPSRRVGRPPVGLSLRTEGEFLIGVNIGVRQSQVGAITADGMTLAAEAFDTPAGAAEALASIGKIIELVCQAASGRVPVAVGVSVPGPVDATRARLLHAPHLDWRDVDIAADLSRNLRAVQANQTSDLPVIVENDATAATLYELRRRRARGAPEKENFVLVRAGTGIGVGVVTGGEIYRGAGAGSPVTGEFGHMTIVAGGKPCVCGGRGCWERYASARSATTLYAGDRFRAQGGTAPHFSELVARAAAGEMRARRTLEQTGEYLGVGIANVITGVGVSHVVISGRVVLGWEFIRESLHAAVARSMAGRLTRWTIEAGEETGAGIGGAIEVAIEEHLLRLADRVRLAA